MMGIARTIVAETYAPYEIFISLMVIYLILTWLIQRSFRLDRKTHEQACEKRGLT